MEFTNREMQYPGKRKLIKVDEENKKIPNEPEILVNIVKDEGNVISEGTPITAEDLNKGNWRDDDSLSFQMSTDAVPRNAKAAETQIVTTADGSTWIVPPAGLGVKTKIGGISLGNGTTPGLSDNNYTTNEKNKVANIPPNTNDALALKAPVSHAAAHRVGGSDAIGLGNGTAPGLSTNDYASSDKIKLNGIEANAQVNITEGALLGNVDVQIDSNKKLILPAVLQQTGQSATDVMSQKAVTDEVDKKFGASDLYNAEGKSTATSGTTIATTDMILPSIAVGTTIRVKFTNGYAKRTSGTNITVNVNGTNTNYAIWVNGAAIASTNPMEAIQAGERRVFRYNGTKFELVFGVPLWTDIQGNIAVGSGWRTVWTGTATNGSTTNFTFAADTKYRVYAKTDRGAVIPFEFEIQSPYTTPIVGVHVPMYGGAETGSRALVCAMQIAANLGSWQTSIGSTTGTTWNAGGTSFYISKIEKWV